MGMMGTYQRVAILDCTSGIQLETYDDRTKLLLGQLERCDLVELSRLRTEVIPRLEAELTQLEAEAGSREGDEEDGDDV